VRDRGLGLRVRNEMIVLCYEHGVLIHGMDGCIGVRWRFGVCFEKTSSWIGDMPGSVPELPPYIWEMGRKTMGSQKDAVC